MAKCRLCSSELVLSEMNFGEVPFANNFRALPKVISNESKYLLQIGICNHCNLIQHSLNVEPGILFSDYAYFSSVSKFWLERAKNFADSSLKLFNKKNISVIEIASNDGYLLKEFVKNGSKVLGIEPAENIATEAIRNGIPTLIKFFSNDIVLEIIDTFGIPDLIVANNVMAHAPDINNMISAIEKLMNDDSIFSVEFPHALEMIVNNEFDTIYHEHFFYFTIKSFSSALNKHGLKIIDIEKIDSHGGSLRIFSVKNSSKRIVNDRKIDIYLEEEQLAKLYSVESLNSMAACSKKIKDNAIKFVINEKINNEKIKISFLGAAAKGNTFVNYCGNNLLEYIDSIYDETTFKIGKYYPGTDLKVKNPSLLEIDRPDILIILPWNHKDEIIERYKIIKNWGGKFVMFIPELQIY